MAPPQALGARIVSFPRISHCIRASRRSWPSRENDGRRVAARLGRRRDAGLRQHSRRGQFDPLTARLGPRHVLPIATRAARAVERVRVTFRCSTSPSASLRSRSPTRCLGRSRPGFRVRLLDHGSFRASSSGRAVRGLRERCAESSLTSSSARVRPSGAGCADLRYSCRTDTKARVRSIPPRVSNDSCSSAPRTTCGVRAFDARADVSHDPSADSAQPAQTAHRHDAEVSASSRVVRVVARRPRQRRILECLDEIDKLTPAPCVAWCCPRQGVLRPAQGAPCPKHNKDNVEVALVRVEQL